MPTHRVAARTAGTLHGGRPFAPGDLITPDPHADRALINAGLLVPLAHPAPRRRRRTHPTVPANPPAAETAPAPAPAPEEDA